jgi:hypothetical protein
MCSFSRFTKATTREFTAVSVISTEGNQGKKKTKTNKSWERTCVVQDDLTEIDQICDGEKGLQILLKVNEKGESFHF